MAQNGKLGIVSEVARWARVYLGLYERVDSFEVAADEAGSLIPGAPLFSITFPGDIKEGRDIREKGRVGISESPAAETVPHTNFDS